MPKEGITVESCIMKVYNIRDAIFEPLINKYYEDPTLVAYGEDVRDWGGAYAVYRGLMPVLSASSSCFRKSSAAVSQ